MEQNKFVYLLEVDYEINHHGRKAKANAKIGVYEDANDAVEAAMMNADSDLIKDDVLNALDSVGECEIGWNNMMIGCEAAMHVRATITEHTMIRKSSES